MKGLTLGEAMKQGRSNNLSFLRFIAALLVIISHAYPLSKGIASHDMLETFSRGSLGFGSFAVGVFFFSSGLLIARSVEKSKKTLKYFKARCIRIFPPLFVIVLLTIFVFGPIFSKASISNYLTDPETYKYLLNGVLIPIHELPLVFQDNIYGAVVNGALWTLPVEFLCYFGLFIFYKMKLLKKKPMLFTTILAGLVFVLCFYTSIPLCVSIRPFMLPVFIFYVGMLMYVCKEYICMNTKIALILLSLWLVTTYMGYAEIAMILFFPYIMMFFLFSKHQCSSNLAKLGDLSYGIYLSGFVIQQSLVALFGGSMQIWMNILIAIPLSIIVGYFIYFISERPFYHH